MKKIREGDIGNAQHLINTGVDVNIQDENDMTPLMIASQAGHTELVEQLIKSGADVNLVIQLCYMPLGIQNIVMLIIFQTA